MEHSSRGGAGRGSVSPYMHSDSSCKLSDADMDQDDNDNVFLEDSDERHQQQRPHLLQMTGYRQQQHTRQHHNASSYTIRTSSSHAQSASSGAHRHCSDSKSASECSDQSQCESPLTRGGADVTGDPFPVNKSQLAHCNSSVTMVDPFQSEKEFIDYLLSLPSSSNKMDGVGRGASPPLPPPIVVGTTMAAQRRDNVNVNVDDHASGSDNERHGLLKPNKLHQSQQQPSSLSGTQSPKIGLDHLENLCKLMEQLGELREQNLKLQKRVQYLEEVRCLNEMRKDLQEALDMVNTSQQLQQASAPGGATVCAQSSSAMALRSSATEPSIAFHAFDYENELRSCDDRGSGQLGQSPLGPSSTAIGLTVQRERLGASTKRAKGSVKLRKTISKQQRGRSQSMGDDELIFRQFVPSRHDAVCPTTATTGCARKIKSAKVSKWSKVKEALKWERAQTLQDHGSVVGGTHSDPARSSFYVDVDAGAVQVSRATITLTPPSSSKSSEVSPHGSTLMSSSSDTLGYIVDSPPVVSSATIKNTGPLVAFASARGSFRDGSGVGGVGARADGGRDGQEALMMPMAYLSRESYLETSSDEEMEPVEEHLGRKGRSLERDAEHKMYARYSQSEKEAKKMSKGAWGKVKNIIQTRKDSLKRKHRKSGGEAEFQRSSNVSESELSIAADLLASDELWAATSDQTNYSYARQAPAVVFATDEHQMALDHSQQHQQNQFKIHSCPSSTYGAEDFGASPVPPVADRSTKPTRKVKPQLTIQPPATDHPLLTAGNDDDVIKSRFPTNFLTEQKDWEDRKRYHQGNDYGNYDNALELLQSILTEKQAETELIPYETKRHLEELQRNISHDFSKKLQEWEKLKTNYSPGKHQQDSGHHQQQGLMAQQASSSASHHQQHSPKLDRKGSGQKTRKVNKVADNVKGKDKFERDQKGVKQREKELQWLEKQLQKIEREKQRLAKERQKYLEREARLEKMKETMMKPQVKNEILVRTSAGEFRFEGISQTFTRKLYEWEEMRGIGPEVSTIALLDSTHSHQQPTSTPQRASSVKATSSSSSTFDKLQYQQQQHQSPSSCVNVDSLAPPSLKYGRLDRHRSRSESSVADIVNVQTSTTSLAPRDDDDDEDCADLCAYDYDALFADLSRANSEPDLARFGLTHRDGSSEPPYAIEVEELHIEESIPCLDIPAFHVEEPVYSYAPSEVTRLIDSSSGSSDVEKDSTSDMAAEAAAKLDIHRRSKMAAETVSPVDGAATTAISSGVATVGGSREETNFGHFLLDEDISLLETLTAKEEICRQLETDLENLDGKMKLMFQQHSEEIQKLRSQEGILKDMEVGHEDASTQKSMARGTSTSSNGSPENSIKQKQLIEQLKARIVELEMAGECLKREREDLEETFKKHTEHQGQLTQHLAARITELQQESLNRKTTDDISGHERVASHSKKKEGVVKVQNLSAELLQQAKTLEQALQDRNSTIRQLQWELLQRDMSAIQLQGELEKVKEKSTARVFRSDSKLKKNHNRSWSSVDAAYNGQKSAEIKKIDSGVPIQVHKISDSPEFAALPIELTKKVRELKTELMRLWSSGESANSVGSDPEETSSARRKNTVNENGNGADEDELNRNSFATGSYSTDKSSSVETVILAPAKRDGTATHTTCVTSPKTGARKKHSSPSAIAATVARKASNGAADHESTSSAAAPPTVSTLTTRRVSDTSIPSEMPATPEFGRKQKRLKSKMAPPGGPPETSVGNADAESGQQKPANSPPRLQTETQSPSLPSSPMVSRIPSRICPLSPSSACKLSIKTDRDESANSATSGAAVNYTISLKPKLNRAANVSSTEKPIGGRVEPRAPCDSGGDESIVTPSDRIETIEAAVTLPNPTKAIGSVARQSSTESASASTVVAVMPLPRKQLVRSPALRESIGGQQAHHQRRSPYSKPSINPSSLHRQNAEDLCSSSDTDTEDSGGGVTFTINIATKPASSTRAANSQIANAPKEKKACAPVATAVSGNGRKADSEMCSTTARIPLKRQDKIKEPNLETQITVIAACPPISGLKSPGMQRSRALQDPTKCGATIASIKSPPPSPSTALWRKASGAGYSDAHSVGANTVSPISSPRSFRGTKPAAAAVAETTGYSPLSSPAMVSKMASSLLESKMGAEKTSELLVPEESKLVAPETPVVKSRSTRKLKIPIAGKATTLDCGLDDSLIKNTSTTNSNTSIPASITPSPPNAITTPPVPLTMEFSPMSGRRLTKDPAPSVKTMIDKYNLKLSKETTSGAPSGGISLLRSPQMGLNRMRYGAGDIGGGVKKSTSFTAAPSYDIATNYRNQPPGGNNGSSHVVKSASAGKIDGRMISFRQMPPMSPELPSKHGALSGAASSSGAPGSPIVGIASRIPRCLKAICEQESGETSLRSSAATSATDSVQDVCGFDGAVAAITKEQTVTPDKNSAAVPTPNTQVRSSPPVSDRQEESNSITSVPATSARNFETDSSHGFHSPITGIRALQIRRAREEFLTKIPSLSPTTTSPIPERHQFPGSATEHRNTTSMGSPGTHHQQHPVSPLMAHALRHFNNRGAANQSSQIPETSQDCSTATTTNRDQSSLSSINATRPKGILKATRPEPPASQAETSVSSKHDEPEDPDDVIATSNSRIVKSASTGTVDEEMMNADQRRSYQDGGDGLSDDGSRTSDSSAQHQSHKSGLFNFKFRKAKLKQKKDAASSQSFNTVKALCRQSLLVDLPPHTSGGGNDDDVDMSRGPLAVSARSCPSSPELQPKQNVKSSWLTKPKILFKSK